MSSGQAYLASNQEGPVRVRYEALMVKQALSIKLKFHNCPSQARRAAYRAVLQRKHTGLIRLGCGFDSRPRNFFFMINPLSRRHHEQNLPVVVLISTNLFKGWFRLFEINPVMGIKGRKFRLAARRVQRKTHKQGSTFLPKGNC